jgi:hypothetical protein
MLWRGFHAPRATASTPDRLARHSPIPGVLSPASQRLALIVVLVLALHPVVLPVRM